MKLYQFCKVLLKVISIGSDDISHKTLKESANYLVALLITTINSSLHKESRWFSEKLQPTNFFFYYVKPGIFVSSEYGCITTDNGTGSNISLTKIILDEESIMTSEWSARWHQKGRSVMQKFGTNYYSLLAGTGVKYWDECVYLLTV